MKANNKIVNLNSTIINSYIKCKWLKKHQLKYMDYWNGFFRKDPMICSLHETLRIMTGKSKANDGKNIP